MESLGEDIPEAGPLLVTDKKKVNHYYVEIMYLLTSAGGQLFDTISTNTLEIHFCRYIWNIPEDQCLNTSSTYIHSAQKFAATFEVIEKSLHYLVPLILLFFIGPWSDVHGRKMLLTLPTIGMMISHGLWTWASAVPSINPLFFILSRLPYMLLGGGIIMVYAAHCSLCDQTNEGNRSFRLGMLQTAGYVGYLFGGVVCVFLIPEGYTAVFFVSTVLVMFAAIIVCFFHKETAPTYKPSMRVNKNVFRLEYLRELVRWYQKQSSKNRRTITLAIVARLLFYFVLTGTGSLIYLFLQIKMDIKLEEYAVYVTFQRVTHVVGLMGVTYILSNKLRINDVYVLVLIVISYLFHLGFFIFSNTMWLIYVGTAIGSASSLHVMIYKSFISKIVDDSDIGKVLAVGEVAESLMGLAASFVYPILYQITLATFPEAAYVLSALVCIVILVIQITIVKMNDIPLRQEQKGTKIESSQ